MGSEDYIEEKKTLGLRISRLREDRGYSQREFAPMIGMDRVYLSKIESGKTNPSLVSIIRIAEGLQVGLPELFSDPVDRC